MKISLCFTHPQSILGVYDFLLSDESKRSYIKNCPLVKRNEHFFLTSADCSSPTNYAIRAQNPRWIACDIERDIA